MRDTNLVNALREPQNGQRGTSGKHPLPCATIWRKPLT